MDSKNIIRDVFLVEFCEKKTSNVYLVNQQQTHKYTQILDSKITDLICVQSGSRRSLNEMFYDEDFNIGTNMGKYFPTVLECLKLCDGKLSYCGTLQELFVGYNVNYSPHYLNLYFHSCTVDEATKLLEQCLKLFSDKSCYIEDNCIIVSNDEYYVVFHSVICKTKQELLLNRSGIERQLWNFKDGYITTLSTSIAIAMCALPLDITFPCSNLVSCELSGIGIILHGLNSSNQSSFNGYILNKDICAIYENNYFELPDCAVFFHSRGMHIEQRGLNIYSANSLDINFSANINRRISNIGESTKLILEECNLIYFQQTNRSNFNLREYFGKNYKIHVVGIDNDRYVAILNCTRYYGLPKDLSETICYYCLNIEATLAKDRLLSLCN